ncbi:MAG: FlgD immunoglobulin-like domain containing protein, partial [bacterium]
DVNFSEPVKKSTAETKNNYSINNNIEVIGAVRDANLTTVHLITSSHKNGVAYTLTVNNVEDYAGNKITTNSQKQYTFNSNDFPEVPGDKDGQTPTNFALFQNYPNPFNPETEIRFYLDESRKINLKIYNALGQLINTLVQDEMAAGFHTVVWDGTNENGLQVPTGVYIYSLELSRNVLKGNLLVNVSLERRVRRMTLIR